MFQNTASSYSLFKVAISWSSKLEDQLRPAPNQLPAGGQVVVKLLITNLDQLKTS